MLNPHPGYGHSTPHTVGGKLFTMVYALVGIPLGLVMFQSIGERLNNFSSFVIRNAKRMLKYDDIEASETNLIMVVTTLSTITISGSDRSLARVHSVSFSLHLHIVAMLLFRWRSRLLQVRRLDLFRLDLLLLRDVDDHRLRRHGGTATGQCPNRQARIRGLRARLHSLRSRHRGRLPQLARPTPRHVEHGGRA